MRRHWSGVCAQIEVHTTHFSLHMQSGSSQGSLEDSIKLSFSCWRVTKKPLHHDKDIDHPIVVLRFSELPQFLITLNWGNLFVFPWQTAMHWICGTTTGTTLSSTIGKIDQLDFSDYGLVSSDVFIWLLFVYVSPSVLFHQSHSSSSLFKPRIIFFQRIYFHSKTLQGCIHVALVIWQIRFFFVPLDWFFAQAMWEIRFILVWQSLMYFPWMTRAGVTLSASLLVFSSISLSCLSTNFCL